MVEILILHVLSHSHTKFDQNQARNARVVALRHFFCQFTSIYANLRLFFFKTISIGFDSYSTSPKPLIN